MLVKGVGFPYGDVFLPELPGSLIFPFVFLWYCYPQVKACCKVCITCCSKSTGTLTDQMWGIPDQILIANGPTANGLAVSSMWI